MIIDFSAGYCRYRPCSSSTHFFRRRHIFRRVFVGEDTFFVDYSSAKTHFSSSIRWRRIFHFIIKFYLRNSIFHYLQFFNVLNFFEYSSSISDFLGRVPEKRDFCSKDPQNDKRFLWFVTPWEEKEEKNCLATDSSMKKSCRLTSKRDFFSRWKSPKSTRLQKRVRSHRLKMTEKTGREWDEKENGKREGFFFYFYLEWNFQV